MYVEVDYFRKKKAGLFIFATIFRLPEYALIENRKNDSEVVFFCFMLVCETEKVFIPTHHRASGTG